MGPVFGEDKAVVFKNEGPRCVREKGWPTLIEPCNFLLKPIIVWLNLLDQSQDIVTGDAYVSS